MGCFIPDCRCQAVPGDAVCATHARVEADAVAYHEYVRAEELAAAYPGLAEEAAQAATRAKEAARVEAIERASRVEWVGDGTDYGVRRMEHILAELWQAAPDGRNVALCRAAWCMGALVASDDLRLDAAESVLRRAGEELGLSRHEVASVLSTRRVSSPWLRGLQSAPVSSFRRAGLAA